MLEKNKGITLIALVVTIIVLLILAGVSITMVAGDNGIATKAKKSSEATELGNIKEKIKLEVSEVYTDNLGTLTEEEFIAVLENYGTLSTAEENVLDKTLTTDPDKTDASKSFEIKVSDLYNGNFGENEDETVKPETKYTVTFCDYDGTLLKTVEVAAGETASYGEEVPTKAGEWISAYYAEYTFWGWSTAVDSTTVDADLTNVQSNFSVYARYTYVASCFVAGTEILTEDGLINIEDIKVGMNVYSKNLKTGNLELKEVLNTMKYDVKKHMVKVYVNRDIIESTIEHPYYVVDKGWTEAGNLSKDDILINSKNEEVKVENIEIIKSNGNIVTVYNFEVEDNHNYYVGLNEILVHNKQFDDNGPVSSYNGIL